MKQQENKAFNPPRILLTSRISRLEIELLHIPVSSIILELEAPPLAITQLFRLFAIRFGLQGRSSNFKPRSFNTVIGKVLINPFINRASQPFQKYRICQY